jgi:23S rRNA pseudoU1915 N3-methylase RlmH
MQQIIQSKQHIIINTLDEDNQKCLIINTIAPEKEVEIINKHLNKSKDIKIVIYGENSNDNKLLEKYTQLHKLGFTNVNVYIGGLFEWMLLQDIYGEEEFPTTSKELDLLRFKPTKTY